MRWVKDMSDDIGKGYTSNPPMRVKIILVLLKALVAEARSWATGSY